MSVIKRLFGEYVTSRLIRTQNRELSFRCIAYNMHRLTNLVIIVMISTEPLLHYKDVPNELVARFFQDICSRRKYG